MNERDWLSIRKALELVNLGLDAVNKGDAGGGLDLARGAVSDAVAIVEDLRRAGIGCPDRLDRRAGIGCPDRLDRRAGHPRFYELLDQVRATHEAKGADYSRPDDILSNLRGAEQLGIPAWVGVVLRLSDKFERVKNLARKLVAGEAAAVRDESVVDTMMDGSNYFLLAVILFEEWERNVLDREFPKPGVMR